MDGARDGVSGSPRLAGAGVGRVSVRAEGLAVNKGLGDDVDDLVPVEAEQLGDNGGGRDLDKAGQVSPARAGKIFSHDVVETDSVERVLEGEAALDLVGHDHAGEDVLDGERGQAGSGHPVRDGEDTSTAVGGVSPLGGKEAWGGQSRADGTVHAQSLKSNQRIWVPMANAPRLRASAGPALSAAHAHGVDLEGGSRDLGPVGHDGALDDGRHELEALGRHSETLESTSDRVCAR